MDDIKIRMGGKTEAFEAPEKAFIARMGEKHVPKGACTWWANVLMKRLFLIGKATNNGREWKNNIFIRRKIKRNRKSHEHNSQWA